ncbi:MAG: FMN-dependent NADH-azoreductase [Gammaproteobacteria bacterium]|jgi:FMN-dependent NADH-azoreductase|nr:FMN-dependent NADH-azoreductase [Gammaproteobacteria bacterium]MBT4463030.1 FMN-dependent NADH-azoreductase [Gammaproteobacteria bacterium]MBT4654561.1 FMN-dependent NADH-azoreductase [Gammaproteobacteria bacterium]
MEKIIYIEGSPRKNRSHSISIATEYLDKIKENDSSIEIKTIDLWSMDLPEFNGDMLDAKYAVINGSNPTESQKKAWGQVEKIFNEFADADHYLFSVPMWNFNIPYKLKQFIDIVTQPGLSWSYSADDGYKGLMSGRTATVVYSSGDKYSEGTGFESYDLQKPYINLWLTFIGFDKIEKVTVDKTLFEPEEAEKRASDIALKLANIHSLK